MTAIREASAEERVAIVTGASRGIGLATVRALARCGYAVVVDYAHDQRAAESSVDMVLATNGTAVAVRADVADELDVQRLFTETIDAFGGVDVVVHVASGQVVAVPVGEVEVDEFDDLCRINTRAPLLVSREAARRLRDGGTLVNLSTAYEATSQSAYGLYVATRAAAEVLTRTLAVELRHRSIAVVGVALDVDRPCEPDVVADVVARLVADGGHRLTGQVLRVDDPRVRTRRPSG
jgi:3-oxoacyl-[acyl-carrier protein] reductase